MTPRRHQLIARSLAALVVGGFLAAIAPLPIGLLSAADEADALAARLAEATARRPDLARLAARRDALAAAGDTATAVIRATDAGAAERVLTEHLAAVANAAGAELADERPLVARADGGLLLLRRRLALRMPVDRLEPLLLTLETAQPALFVETIEVERRGDDGLAATIDLVAPAEIAPVRAALSAAAAAAPRTSASALPRGAAGEAATR